ncbi:hypothetical protein AAAU98_26150 [Enterocloster citroniae]|uniref:hypothetical protein n=1 Tax=Enterocloster citroniae TaxID=358743 RepID=UPI0032C02CEC
MIINNAIKMADSTRVPARYSISCDETFSLIHHYRSPIEIGLAFFRLGYLQGMKAAKAEQRRKEAATCKE